MQETKKIFTKPDEMYQAAARYLADTLQQTIAKAGDKPFSFVLTGGSTPAPLYTLLASAYTDLPWSKVHFFWGDERYVSPRDSKSNYKLAYDTLLAHLALDTKQIHPIPTEQPEPAGAAAAYQKELIDYFTRISTHPQPTDSPFPDWPRSVFDLTLLGMGPDGHIASLFPHSPALNITDKLVTYVDKAPLAPQVPRITMTLPLINNSERVVLLISGEQKVNLLEKLDKGPDEVRAAYPVARVQARKELVWFICQ